MNMFPPCLKDVREEALTYLELYSYFTEVVRTTCVTISDYRIISIQRKKVFKLQVGQSDMLLVSLLSVTLGSLVRLADVFYVHM